MLLSLMLLGIKIRWIVIKGDVLNYSLQRSDMSIVTILALQMKINLLIG